MATVSITVKDVVARALLDFGDNLSNLVYATADVLDKNDHRYRYGVNVELELTPFEGGLIHKEWDADWQYKGIMLYLPTSLVVFTTKGVLFIQDMDCSIYDHIEFRYIPIDTEALLAAKRGCDGD